MERDYIKALKTGGVLLGFTMIITPQYHPVAGMVTSVGSYAIILLLVELADQLARTGFASGGTSETDENYSQRELRLSLAQMLSEGNEDKAHSMNTYASVEEVKEAYVNGEITDVQFEQLLESFLEDTIDVDADGMFVEEKSRVAETSDEDPRN
jgi:hypothetical protein